MVRFYFMRILKDYLAHAIFIGLPVFLIATLTYINAPDQANWPEASRVIAILFILMFQIFGASYTFEGLQKDFLSPMKDRLHATPVNPAWLVVIQIAYSTLASLLQSMVLIGFTIIFFDAAFENIPGLLGILILSALSAQLLGGLLVLITKSAAKSQVVMTLYAIIAPILAGLNFELPDSNVKPYIEKYSSPVAWANRGLEGVHTGNADSIMFSVLMLIGFAVVLGTLIRHFAKKVIL